MSALHLQHHLQRGFSVKSIREILLKTKIFEWNFLKFSFKRISHLSRSVNVNRNDFPVQITCKAKLILIKFDYFMLLFLFSSEENKRKKKKSLRIVPLRVRLRSSLPLARNSRLQAPRKFSPQTTSPLQFRLWFPLLFPAPQIPRPLSVGITAATFRTSFNALAFNVAAPRRATQERKFSPLT